MRFTTGDYAIGPVWFPDGDRLAYVSVRDTPPNPFVKTMAGVETRVARLPKAVELGSVTADGSTLVGDVLSAGTRRDLWVFPTAADKAPAVFLQTTSNVISARLSPDSRWAAFVSDESGRNEVYVTTFPTAGRQYRVSADGGDEARWTADGREVFFRSGTQVMVAAFSGTADGAPSIGTPRLLFILPEDAGSGWSVADNGQRLLFNVRVTPAQVSPLTVLINWPSMVGGK